MTDKERALEIQKRFERNEDISPEDINWFSKYFVEGRVKDEIKKERVSRDMKNRRRRGRYGEVKLAKEVGGRKDGRVGRRDVGAGMFSYEVKTVQKIPSSIIKLMAQAERLKKRDTTAVGVFRCNSPRKEFFIVERNDWLDIHGGGK